MSRFVAYVGGIAVGIATEQSFQIPIKYAAVALAAVFVFHMIELREWHDGKGADA